MQFQGLADSAHPMGVFLVAELLDTTSSWGALTPLTLKFKFPGRNSSTVKVTLQTQRGCRAKLPRHALPAQQPQPRA